MKVVYVSDAFFQRGKEQACKRLYSFITQTDPDMVMVSRGWQGEDAITEKFLESLNLPVRIDPSEGAVKGSQYRLGQLLRWNGELIVPFDNTAILLDTRSHKWNRIYLDMFPQTEIDPVREVSEELNSQIDSLTKNAGKHRTS